jgi:RHS repeat-associated protein
MTVQTVNGTPTSYSYDLTNQLTNDGTTAYSYTLNGGRTMTGYQLGAANKIINDGTWTFTYDNEGSLTKKSKGASAETWTYGYDNLNRMIWAKDSATDGGSATTIATYVYDVFGNRIEKDVWTQSSGTTTVSRFAYDGQNVWGDFNGSNVLQTRYLRGDAVDQLFARITGGTGGTAGWYLTDWQGSVRNITDSSSNLQDTISYDGFGNVSESNSTAGDRYKYTGREFDNETGLQYNRARYYDAVHGSWTSQDPAGFDAGDANLYRYVANSPTNSRDPSGLNSLAFRTTYGPVGVSWGEFYWAINWKIDPKADAMRGGWVIQHVDLLTSKNISRLILPGLVAPLSWWEAWYVLPNWIEPTDSGSPLLLRYGNDWWYSQKVFRGTTGSISMDGDAWYVDGMNRQEGINLGFRRGGYPAAVRLYSMPYKGHEDLVQKLAAIHPASNEVFRTLDVNWSPTIENGKTILTPGPVP